MDTPNPEMTAAEFLNALGRDSVCARLFADVSVQKARRSLNQAAWVGSFPAKWYAVLKAMADEKLMACPMALFRFDEDLPQQNPSPENVVDGDAA